MAITVRFGDLLNNILASCCERKVNKTNKLKLNMNLINKR